MSLLPIDHHPTRRQLTVFAVIWLLFFGGWAVSAGVRGHTSATSVLVGVALVVSSAVWWSPGLLRLVYVGMAYLFYPVGWVLSYFLLGVLYYLILTPIGVARRLLVADTRGWRTLDEGSSYWQRRRTDRKTDDYFRQF